MSATPPEPLPDAGPATPRPPAQERDRWLQAITDNATVALFIMDTRQHCVFMNPAAERLTGYTLAEVQGAPLHDFVHHTRPDGSPYPLAECPIDRAFPQHNQTRGEEVFVHRDGHFYHVAFTASPIRDERRGVHGTVIEVIDITERRRQEAALRESEQMLRRFLDNSPFPMGVVGLSAAQDDIRHLYDNQATCDFFGIAPGSTAGRLARTELGAHPETVRLWLDHYLDSGRRHAPVRFSYQEPGARARWLDVTVYPLDEGAGSATRYCYVCQDVTARKAAEAALQQADRQKDEFIAVLAHELRNPLAPLRSGLQVLQRAPADSPMAAHARAVMERQLTQMVRLIDDLLDTSRISRGHLALQLRPVALQEVLNDAVETVRPLLQQRSHRLELRLPAQPLVLHADPARMAQVLGNLLSNAAKYTPAGGLVQVQGWREGTEAVVAVRDNGQGIAPEVLTGLFAMFNRGAQPAQGGESGLGIGLALVRQLVQLHGGTVEAASDGPGQGSVFTLRLPLWQPDVDASPAGGAAAQDAPAPGLSVLVVDDNVDAAQSLALLLELQGHRVATVHDGAAALRLLQGGLQARPDVLLLDLGMPGIGGLALARRVRADPALADLVLVAITGWGSEQDRQRSRDAGFDEHLTKPVEIGDIERVLARVAAGQGRRG